MSHNILITGGAGFIGSHLAEKLVKLKYKITIIDNEHSGSKKNLSSILKKINYIKKDISKYDFTDNRLKKINCVYHLAGMSDIVPSIDNPEKYFEANVKGTLNVLEFCRKNNIKRLIYSASSSCYGKPNKFPTSETEKLSEEYPYALSKSLGEQLVLHWGKVYNLNVTSLRLFNVYGSRVRTNGAYGAVFGVFLAQKINNKPFTVVGDGRQKRDFTYVDDVVDIMVKIKDKKNTFNDYFNIGSGKSISINKITQILKGNKIYIPKRPGEPDITFADISKIKKRVGWRPKFNIKEGISIMMQNLEEWKKAPVWTPKKIKLATYSWFKYLKK